MLNIKLDQDGNYYFLMLDDEGKVIVDSRDMKILFDAMGCCPCCGQMIKREDDSDVD